MTILDLIQSNGFDSGKGRKKYFAERQWPLYEFEVY